MKKISVVIFMFVFLAVSIKISAADQVRKKVVKIEASQVETVAPPTKTARVIAPQTLEPNDSDNPRGGNLPGGKPLAEKNGRNLDYTRAFDRGPSGTFVSYKGGFALPRALAGLDVGSTFFSNIMEKVDLNARLGLAYLRGRGLSAAQFSGDVYISWDGLRSRNLPLTVNLGAGLSFPGLVSNNQEGQIGYNVFLTLNVDISDRSQLFVESGYHTLAIKNLETLKGVSALFGLKLFL